jgi:hypothetical protein
MNPNRKVVRYGALGAVLMIGGHIVPHHEESECVQVGMNLCSAEDDFYVPRNEHVPHSERDPNVPGAYRWIASGEVNSTSTGPNYWVSAGESIFRR